MKTVLIIAVSMATAYAQNITVSETPTPTTSVSCPVQSVFDVCIEREKNYLSYCKETDNRCLCTYHTQLCSCWNNCPVNPGFPEQSGIMKDMCSRPGANVSISLWSSTFTPSSTYSLIRSSATPFPSASTVPPKASSGLPCYDAGVEKTIFALVGVAVVYMLF